MMGSAYFAGPESICSAGAAIWNFAGRGLLLTSGGLPAAGRPDRSAPKCAALCVSGFWLWLAGRLGRLRLGLLLGRSFLVCREDRGGGSLPRGLDCLWSFRARRRACR